MSDHRVALDEQARILADALPYIRALHGKTLVIRYDGSAMTEPALQAAFGSDVAMLRLVGVNPIVVHGGGPQIDAVLKEMGVQPVFRRGMRVTDEKTMQVVEMVLGELNQEIVGLINRQGGKAVGLNGQDGHFIHARRMSIPAAPGEAQPLDLGLVGEIAHIDADLLNILSARGFIPVVMPIGVGADGQAYNVHADLVASRLAQTLQALKLILLADATGVLDRDGRLLSAVSARDLEALNLADGPQAGALPRMDAVLEAVRHGVRAVHVVDGRVPHALLLEVLTSEGVGTTIVPDDAPRFLEDARRYLEADGQPPRG